MGWRAYEIVFKLESPLHIGYHKVGLIQRTRFNITGKAMWGAATARMARLQMERLRTRDESIYEQYGELFKKKLIFGYFFPALEADGFSIRVPKYKKNGVRYGLEGRLLKEEEFEFKFIRSYVSTAISVEQNTAEEGTLHEIEFISPHTFDRGEQVYFIGHLFVSEEIEGYRLTDDSITIDGFSLFDQVLRFLQVGGERRYGFGKLAFYNKKKVKDLFGLQLSLHHSHPEVILRKGEYILAHLEVADISVRGAIEPVVGREWRIRKGGNGAEGAGRELTPAKICFVPGTEVLEDEVPCKIGEFGIWSKRG
jgi:hypothetical protein